MRGVALGGLVLLAACGEGTAPPPPMPFSLVSTGSEHTCAIDIDAHAYCWGRNTFGQLGDDRAGHAQ